MLVVKKEKMNELEKFGFINSCSDIWYKPFYDVIQGKAYTNGWELIVNAIGNAPGVNVLDVNYNLENDSRPGTSGWITNEQTIDIYQIDVINDQIPDMIYELLENGILERIKI